MLVLWWFRSIIPRQRQATDNKATCQTHQQAHGWQHCNACAIMTRCICRHALLCMCWHAMHKSIQCKCLKTSMHSPCLILLRGFDTRPLRDAEFFKHAQASNLCLPGVPERCVVPVAQSDGSVDYESWPCAPCGAIESNPELRVPQFLATHRQRSAKVLEAVVAGSP